MKRRGLWIPEFYPVKLLPAFRLTKSLICSIVRPVIYGDFDPYFSPLPRLLLEDVSVRECWDFSWWLAAEGYRSSYWICSGNDISSKYALTSSEIVITVIT
jgi:hypothetical protein